VKISRAPLVGRGLEVRGWVVCTKYCTYIAPFVSPSCCHPVLIIRLMFCTAEHANFKLKGYPHETDLTLIQENLASVSAAENSSIITNIDHCVSFPLLQRPRAFSGLKDCTFTLRKSAAADLVFL
jgi:hypothetical protein